MAAPNQLPTISTLLTQSWRVLLKKWRLLFALTLIPTLTTLLFFSAIGFSTSLVPESSLQQAFTSDQLTQPAPLIILTSLSFLLIAFIITINLWFNIAALITIKNRSQSLKFHQVVPQAWPLIAKYWWTSILGALAALGGFLFFVIPGILLSLYFTFSSQVVIDQGKTGIIALWTSRELIKGKILAVIWRFLGLFAIIILVSIIVQAGSSAWIKAFGDPIGQPISTFANLITSLSTNIFATIYTWLIYEELTKLKGKFQVQITPRRKFVTWGLALVTFLALMATIAALLNFLPHIPSLLENPADTFSSFIPKAP
jgi:hypothetical protein